MALTRREFLKTTLAGAVAAVAFTGCIPRSELQIQSPPLMPEDLVEGRDLWYATLNQAGPGGDGLIVRVMAGRAKKIEGNPDYPINAGKTSAIDQAIVQDLYHPDRISRPLKRRGDRGSGQFYPISWDQAYGELASKLRGLSGQADRVVLATEPLRAHQAYLVDKFVTAYGARHLAFDPLAPTVERSVLREMFGQDALPEFDIRNSNYLVSFGTDFLMTWLSPVRYGRHYGEFRQGRSNRGYFVQVEPRLSITGANADEWVPIKPGTEGMLALSMAQVILAENLAGQSSIQAIPGGAASLHAYEPGRVSEATGVAAERIRKLARAFAQNQPALAIAGGAAAAHTNGSFNLMAAYALNAVVGNVGKPGGLIFNPPAPTEGFASRLPAASHAEWHRFAEGVRTGSSPVDALLVHRVNPLYGMPAATGMGAALEKIPFIASFSSYLDDTTLMADLILPDSSILESWGDDVPDPSPGYQTVGVQQPVVRQFYNTRGFFDGLLSISRKLGGQVASELPWGTVRDLLREDARQLRALNRGSVPIGADFERFWVNLLQRGGWWDENSRVTTVPAAKLQPPPAPPDAASEFAGSADEYPFYLVPFPHFTMQAGEGAHLPWLQSAPDTMTSATWQTWVELNPRTADSLQIKMFDVVRVETVVGALEASVYINPAAAPDIIAIPMGQGHRGSGRYAEDRGENVLRILAPLTDRGTGALAWCATRARISKVGKWQRVALLDRYLEGVPKSRELPDAKIIGITKE